MARPATGSTSPDALDLAPGIPPWEHQPGETAEAFHRFLQFLEVDPLVRSKNRMEVVHQLLTDRDPHMCSVAALQNMASLNQWHLRAGAYDSHQRRQRQLAAERAEQQWAETLARRRAEIQLKHLDAASEIIQTGLRALSVKDLDKVSAAEAARLIELGYRMERETLHLAGSPGGQPDRPGHVNDLNDDQTAARLRQLADELARRINNQTTAAAAPDVMDAEVIPHPRDSSDDDLDTWPDVPEPGRLAIEPP